jgi:hypothetical protein
MTQDNMKVMLIQLQIATLQVLLDSFYRLREKVAVADINSAIELTESSISDLRSELH